MTQNVSILAAAEHYGASAAFWEARSKLLVDQLVDTKARVIELEGQVSGLREELAAYVDAIADGDVSIERAAGEVGNQDGQQNPIEP